MSVSFWPITVFAMPIFAGPHGHTQQFEGFSPPRRAKRGTSYHNRWDGWRKRSVKWHNLDASVLFRFNLFKIFLRDDYILILSIFESFDNILRTDFLSAASADFLYRHAAHVPLTQLIEMDIMILRRSVQGYGNMHESKADSALM